jgi:phage baseplate assembly protein W
MSFDFQLAHACPHLTIEEEVPLAPDRQELRTLQPVASSSRIRITANDQVSIPQQGLLSGAMLSGSVSGPFKIVKNENSVSFSNRTQRLDVDLPVGSRIATSRVVDLLNAAFKNQGLDMQAADVNGFLRVRDNLDEGPRSRIRVEGAATRSLGFVHQVRARGREVYPPWVFAERDVLETTRNFTSVRQISSRFPRFTKPVKGNPVFKVTYTTYQQHCRRCQGYGIENDYRIASSGSPLTVVNEDLLNQGVLKILSTIKGSNPFNVEYGTTLLERIGTKAIGAAAGAITEDVTVALNVFQRLQTAQGRYQEVTSRERLASLISVRTFPSDIDPTIFEVEIVASNASNRPVVITTVYAAPGTAALAGSNGLSLGLEGFGLDPRTGTLPGVASR